MEDPKVTWLDSNLDVLSKIQFNNGVVDGRVLADMDSAEVVVHIANNFTKNSVASTDCFSMDNCTLTVKAANGSMNEQLVQQKWIRARAVSKGETLDSQAVKIGAHLDVDGITWVEDSHPIGCGDPVIGENSIAGTINDGTKEGTGKNNTAIVSMICHPDINASAGKHSFLFRLTYEFGQP